MHTTICLFQCSEQKPHISLDRFVLLPYPVSIVRLFLRIAHSPQEALCMFQRLDPIFAVFRPCFSREASFQWCVIFIMGFLIRADHEG